MERTSEGDPNEAGMGQRAEQAGFEPGLLALLRRRESDERTTGQDWISTEQEVDPLKPHP